MAPRSAALTALLVLFAAVPASADSTPVLRGAEVAAATPAPVAEAEAQTPKEEAALNEAVAEAAPNDAGPAAEDTAAAPSTGEEAAGEVAAKTAGGPINCVCRGSISDKRCGGTFMSLLQCHGSCTGICARMGLRYDSCSGKRQQEWFSRLGYSWRGC